MALCAKSRPPSPASAARQRTRAGRDLHLLPVPMAAPARAAEAGGVRAGVHAGVGTLVEPAAQRRQLRVPGPWISLPCNGGPLVREEDRKRLQPHLDVVASKFGLKLGG